MGSLLGLAPHGCFAIRIYRRRWLMATRMHAGTTVALGWRTMSWTSDLAVAEKWFTRAAAERFAACLNCPCEVVDVEAKSKMTPEHA